MLLCSNLSTVASLCPWKTYFKAISSAWLHACDEMKCASGAGHSEEDLISKITYSLHNRKGFAVTGG